MADHMRISLTSEAGNTHAGSSRTVGAREAGWLATLHYTRPIKPISSHRPPDIGSSDAKAYVQNAARDGRGGDVPRGGSFSSKYMRSNDYQADTGSPTGPGT